MKKCRKVVKGLPTTEEKQKKRADYGVRLKSGEKGGGVTQSYNPNGKKGNLF